MSSHVSLLPGTRDALRAARGCLARLKAGEVAAVMARREAARFVHAPRSRQGLALALLAAAAFCLLIPLYRAYGPSGARLTAPYLLLFALLLQGALFLLSARAVWVSMRHDAASGSLDELLLTGARPAEMLLGKWLGLCGASLLWTAMLLPVLLLAAALTGRHPMPVFTLAFCLWLSAAAGGLVGTVLTLTEHSRPLAASLPFLIQFWIMLRVLLPAIGSGLGPAWTEAMLWVRRADPITLVPAALGAVREPWLLKAGVVGAGLVMAVSWILLAAQDLPLRRAAGVTADSAGLLSLRPVRLWLVGSRAAAAPDYDRDAAYAFERAHGWRLRVSLPAWYGVLFFTAVIPLPIAILGPEGHPAALALAAFELAAASVISGLGAAAALASEREQGRWPFLLCSPLALERIVLAKWRAAWMESWPLWATAAGRTLVFAIAGALPWAGAPVGMVAVPVAAGCAAAVAAALCAHAPSLTAAQQRAVLVLAVPPLLVLGVGWLLPGLPSLGYFSLPHVVVSALSFRPGFTGAWGGMAALAAYSLVGAGALALARWQLRRWPPA